MWAGMLFYGRALHTIGVDTDTCFARWLCEGASGETGGVGLTKVTPPKCLFAPMMSTNPVKAMIYEA
jgi:hypothetical protein